MNIQYAYRVAASYDFNRDGIISTGPFGKELSFDRDAKRRTDWNHDGRVSLDEFAQALARNDVYIGYDREVHSNNPFGNQPGGYPYPGGGSPYYPGQPGPITYPGGGYGGGYGDNGAFGDILGGAVVGGAVGYVANGKNGLETGAVIGGFIGALGNLFR